MKKRAPRHGSMGVWPRKRATRPYARVRSWAKDVSEVVPLGFAGYKVGMTQVFYTDGKKNSVTKGQDLCVPVTVIECPPLKVVGARAYRKTIYQTAIVAQTMVNGDKDLARKINIVSSDNKKVPKIDAVKDFEYIALICYTQPKLTSIGKKKPELFELRIGGSSEEQLNFAKDIIGKEVKVEDVFKAGFIVDAHAVTVGRGYQGPVKRFGVSIRAKKSEKTKRGPGSICGGWKAHAHMMYRVAFAGQTGYHLRSDFNKEIFLVDSDFAKVNPKGGFIRYGEVKNSYLLIKGSVPGPDKRLITLTRAVRYNKAPVQAPVLNSISTESKQS